MITIIIHLFIKYIILYLFCLNILNNFSNLLTIFCKELYSQKSQCFGNLLFKIFNTCKKLFLPQFGILIHIQPISLSINHQIKLYPFLAKQTHGLPTSTVSTVTVEPLPEVATEAKEEDETLARAAGGVSITKIQQEQQPEPLVSIDKSSDDKKVSSKPIERRRARNVSFERERFRPIRRHRLTIYQEICVWNLPVDFI